MSLTNKVTQLVSSGINQNPKNQNSICMTTYYTTEGEKQCYKPYNSGVAGGGHHSQHSTLNGISQSWTIEWPYSWP